ncbi:MAG: AarF/UbiB family protein, partial [Nanoarchaeota archaeon]
ILEQALQHGLFHADPHPANIFVQRNGKIIFLDYGIVGELNEIERRKVIRFINSVNERNTQKSMEILISLAKDISHADIPAFKDEVRAILEEIYRSSVGEKSFGKGMYEIISKGAQYGVIFDSNHVLMAKSVYQAEGLALTMYPQFKVSEGLDMFRNKYLKQKYTPKNITSGLVRVLSSQKELLEDLPGHLIKILEKMEQPEPPHQIDISQLKELEQEFEYVNKKRVFGIIISALIVSAAGLFYLEGRTDLFGVPFSVAMLVIALFLLLIFLFSHLKRRN